MSINVSSLSIDSRDYLSIFEELQKTVPNLTELWTCTNENDPGVALVKLMAMYGDMLSYNLDRSILEIYVSTVTQRRNAQKIFELIGYKMHWYKSAICTAHINNVSSNDLTMPKLTTFLTTDGQVTYTYFGDNNSGNISLPSYSITDIELVQGIPNTPLLIKDKIADSNSQWHSIYDYNVNKSDILEGCYIYISEDKVDQDHIYLIDDLGVEWVLVENIDMLEDTGRYFEFNIDDRDKPYIKLVSYWENFNVSKFKLFTITTLGEDGRISANTLSETPSSKIVNFTNTGQADATGSVVVSNDPSTIGYGYETPQEARSSSKNFINTFDTLITTGDFTRAVRRIDGVANCKVTDATNDPGNEPMTSTDVKIYITRSDEYRDVTEEVFSSYVLNILNKNKMLHLNIILDYSGINYYTWKISGRVLLKEKVSADTAQGIMVDINNMLKFNYDYSKIDYNSAMNYFDVISTMKQSNDTIDNIDLDPIEYYDSIGNKVPKDQITCQYQYRPDYETGTDITFSIPNVPIKPKTVSMRLNNNQYILYDDGSGQLTSGSNIISEGYISYSSGEVTLKLTSVIQSGSVLVSYEKNAINLVSFAGIDTSTLIVPQDYIKD